MLVACDLKARITILRKDETGPDSDYGTRGYEWVELTTVRAQVQDALPSRAESIDDRASIARRPARIRIRYRKDVTSDMRFQIGERILRIISGPAELGHRKGLEFMAEELSTEGDEP